MKVRDIIGYHTLRGLTITLCLGLISVRLPVLVAIGANAVTTLRVSAQWRNMVAVPEPPTCQSRPGRLGLALPLRLAMYLNPGNSQVYINQARQAWLEGQCNVTRKALAQALSLDPQDETAWMLYLLITEGKEKLPEPEIAHRLSDFMYIRGDQARRLEQWRNAVTWYEIGFRLKPDVVKARKLAAMYEKLEEPAAITATWRQLAQALPESDPGHWWALGQLAELSGSWEEAASFYETGGRIASDPYDFLMRGGAALEQLGAWEAARRAYQEAARARPQDMWSYLRLGHLCRARQDIEGAVEWYSKAATVAPEDWQPVYYLGITSYLQEDCAKAKGTFTRVLAIKPDHANSAYYLAQCLYREGQRDKAITWLRSAIEWHGGQPWQWAVQLGDWLLDIGDQQGALESYRLALTWHPGDATIENKIATLNGQ